jgi:hypothetical protein
MDENLRATSILLRTKVNTEICRYGLLLLQHLMQ